MLVIKAPTPYVIEDNKYTVFLAGAIDMGEAEDWQNTVCSKLADLVGLRILNPRRSAWDSSWKQEMLNPLFKEQVDWELNGLDVADLIVVVFTEHCKAPISFMELGLHVNDNIIVCCHPNFYRKGNVDIVCERYDIPVYNTLDELVSAIRQAESCRS
jgi:hypothetical protein